MWVTHVVSRFLKWNCVAADVIRNHLWVFETRRFRKKMLPADATVDVIECCHQHFQASAVLGEIVYKYFIFTWTVSVLPRQNISAKIYLVKICPVWKWFAMGAKNLGSSVMPYFPLAGCVISERLNKLFKRFDLIGKARCHSYITMQDKVRQKQHWAKHGGTM